MQSTTQNINALSAIFAVAAYDQTPQSTLNKYPTYTNGWTVVWASDPTQPNFAFVGSNGSDYIVAIRGSELNFSKDAWVNWFDEDLDVFKQEAWNWFVPSSQSSNFNAVITAGAMNTLNTLIALTDVTTNITLQDYIVNNAVNNQASIIVTGHSLGGNSASVFAPYMQWYINNDSNSSFNGTNKIYTNMQVVTFAAPAAGNFDFASYADGLFVDRSLRFVNTNDLAPNFPQGLVAAGKMFDGGPQANQIGVTVLGKDLTLSDFFDTTQAAIDAKLLLNGYGFYTQTMGEQTFTNPIDTSYTSNTIEDFMEQGGAQHSRNVYLDYCLGTNNQQASAE